MKKGSMRWILAVLALAVLVAVAMTGCSSETKTDTGTDTGGAEEAKGPVVIGSKIDIEGSILGQIIIQVLENDGFTVTDKTRTGATDVVRKALLAGEIDAYPEYTANALTVFYADKEIDPETLKDAEATYAEASKLDLENAEIVWLTPAPANNTWAVAVPKALAESDNLATLEDWADYINDGGKVKIVGSQEFFDRADAFPGFEKAYGFKLKSDQKVALATGDTAVTEKAAAEGTDGANAAMAYGTDGTIAALDLVVLGDPLGVQPIYQPAPTFRKAIIDTYPEIETLLNPVFGELDLETLQGLNAQVSVEGKDAAVVAAEWLKTVGVLK
ncbi:MAG: ABC transporter substrate-binding protein [Actinomycetota bacterium]|nr:ABC transporter substrate-binding protein [Actinomycetota bacterium]